MRSAGHGLDSAALIGSWWEEWLTFTRITCMQPENNARIWTESLGSFNGQYFFMTTIITMIKMTVVIQMIIYIQ